MKQVKFLLKIRASERGSEGARVTYPPGCRVVKLENHGVQTNGLLGSVKRNFKSFLVAWNLAN
jgi:hypothetical protein